MSIVEEIAELQQKAAAVDMVRLAAGAALTEDQQIAVAAKVAGDKLAFLRFLQTDAGRVAIREFVDQFLAG